MPTILENAPKNLENDVLKGLLNRTVIIDLLNQVETKSRILPHIQVIDVTGDVVKMVGLVSNKPKQFNWGYKAEEFGPSEAVVYKSELTEKDKWIFYYVFSEPIEKLAVDPEKLSGAIAKQTDQVSYDVADFYDNEVVQKYVCDLARYHKNAIIKLNADQLRDVQLLGELLITTGYQMTSPSTRFNLRESRVNVRETQQLLCFIDFAEYARMKVASIYKSPSPVLDELEKIFTVIPVNMVNNMKVALIDSKGLVLAQMLAQRYLKLDEYVASHKVLDHIWRKWIFANFRPAFSIVYDSSAKNILATTTPPVKNILTDYADLKDTKNNTMTEDQAKEWNNFGLDYKTAQDWIDANFLVSDAKLVDWMINTKSKSDTKFQDYNNPEWCLNHLGGTGHKNIDGLRKEVPSA